MPTFAMQTLLALSSSESPSIVRLWLSHAFNDIDCPTDADMFLRFILHYAQGSRARFKNFEYGLRHCSNLIQAEKKGIEKSSIQERLMVTDFVNIAFRRMIKEAVSGNNVDIHEIFGNCLEEENYRSMAQGVLCAGLRSIEESSRSCIYVQSREFKNLRNVIRAAAFSFHSASEYMFSSIVSFKHDLSAYYGELAKDFSGKEHMASAWHQFCRILFLKKLYVAFEFQNELELKKVERATSPYHTIDEEICRENPVSIKTFRNMRAYIRSVCRTALEHTVFARFRTIWEGYLSQMHRNLTIMRDCPFTKIEKKLLTAFVIAMCFPGLPWNNHGDTILFITRQFLTPRVMTEGIYYLPNVF